VFTVQTAQIQRGETVDQRITLRIIEKKNKTYGNIKSQNTSADGVTTV
jgi:hypothetical protein